MYSFESSGSRKPLHALVISTGIVALLLLAVGGQKGIPFPYLFQAGAFILAGIVVFLLVRYSLKLYRYTVEPNGIIDENGLEQYDLTVTEIVGKRLTVVSRVALRDIDRQRVTVIRRSDGSSARQARSTLSDGRTVFHYLNVPAAPEACYIPLLTEPALLVIPADPRMVEILRGM